MNTLNVCVRVDSVRFFFVLLKEKHKSSNSCLDDGVLLLLPWLLAWHDFFIFAMALEMKYISITSLQHFGVVISENNNFTQSRITARLYQKSEKERKNDQPIRDYILFVEKSCDFLFP